MSINYSDKEDGHFDRQWIKQFQFAWKLFCSLRRAKNDTDAVCEMVCSAVEMLHTSDDEHDDCGLIIFILALQHGLPSNYAQMIADMFMEELNDLIFEADENGELFQ